MRYLFITLLSITTFNLYSQEAEVEIDPNVERAEKIQDLINRIEDNRKQLNAIDNKRLNNFINEVNKEIASC